MTATYKCRKCSMEMPARQKVCPRCGEITPAGGKFDVEEVERWRPSAKQMKIGGAAAAVVVLVWVLYAALHVVPPEVVADKWFGAMSSRSVLIAREHVTSGFEDALAVRMMSLQALSDEYNVETNTNRATYRVGKPFFRDSRHAEVSVSLTYPDKSPGPEYKIQMVKIGRKWMVDQVL